MEKLFQSFAQCEEKDVTFMEYELHKCKVFIYTRCSAPPPRLDASCKAPVFGFFFVLGPPPPLYYAPRMQGHQGKAQEQPVPKVMPLSGFLKVR